MSGEVIEGVFGEYTPARSERLGEFCRHETAAIDRHGRIVRCRACGVDLDPLEVLANLVSRHAHYQSVRRDLRRAGEKLANLRKLEKQTKARVRAASRKDAFAAVAAERERNAAEVCRIGRGLLEIAGLAERLAESLPGVPRRERRKRVDFPESGGVKMWTYRTKYELELEARIAELEARLVAEESA